MSPMAGEKAPVYLNKYGRRGGRGLRPYLITLKVFSVAAVLGGLACVQALLAAGLADAATVRTLYRGVIVPGLLGAVVLGLLLALTIGRPLTRMRWFLVKMLLLGLAAPPLHTYAATRCEAWTAAPQQVEAEAGFRRDLQGLSGAGLLLAMALITLGRTKPRLGQNYATQVHRTSSGETPK